MIGCFSQQCLLALQQLMRLDGYTQSNKPLFEKFVHSLPEAFSDTAKMVLLLDNLAVMVRRNHHSDELP